MRQKNIWEYIIYIITLLHSLQFYSISVLICWALSVWLVVLFIWTWCCLCSYSWGSKEKNALIIIYLITFLFKIKFSCLRILPFYYYVLTSLSSQIAERWNVFGKIGKPLPPRKVLWNYFSPIDDMPTLLY